VTPDNSNYSSENGVVFSKNKTTLIQYPGGKKGAYTIPNSVTSIGNYAFTRCHDLTSVTIPSGVTSIGDYAFNDCSGLTSVTIPNSVTSIGDYAFSGCDSLTSVTSLNLVPPTVGSNAFSSWGHGCGNRCLYVPEAAITAYQTATDWGSFTCTQAATIYTVTFNSQGGTSVSSQIVEHGEKTDEPAAPTRTGYTFGGWYREASCANVWSFATDVVTQDTTLYAKWTSRNTNLASLSVSNGTLVPEFHSDTIFYTVAIPSCIEEVTLTATAADSAASVLGTGTKALNVGENTFNVMATAQDTSFTKTYTVLVNRAATIPDTVTLTDTVTIIQTDTVTVTVTVRDTIIQIRVDTVVVVRVDTVYITTPSKPTATAKVEQAKISVYPNPVANGQLIVDNGQWTAGEAIEIYNLNGTLMATYKTIGEKTSLNISQLPNGTYLLRVSGYTAKFVKQ